MVVNCKHCGEPLEPVDGFDNMVACTNGHAIIGTDDPIVFVPRSHEEMLNDEYGDD